MNPNVPSARMPGPPPADAALAERFAGIEQALQPYLAGEAAVPPPQAGADLDALIAAAVAAANERIEYGARSLLAFLAHLPPTGDDASRAQIAALLDALALQLRPGAAPAARDTALIRKPARGQRGDQPIWLLLASKAVTMNFETVLAAAGYRVKPVSRNTGFDGCPPEELPAVILADLSMLREDPAMRAQMQKLRVLRPEAHLICLSSSLDFAARLDAVRLGATRFLPKPVDFAKLVGILDGLTARREVRPLRALLLDDDRALTALYAATLSQAGMTVLACNAPAEAFERIAAFAPDVIVSDIYMPGCNGLEFAAVLRQDEELVDTIILFLSTETNVHRQLDALDLGADDFLVKPVDLDIFTAAVMARARRARMQKRIRAELQLWQQQLQDALNAASG